MQYTKYELSDEHMRGLIHGPHPSLDLIRKAHFDAWLAEHDRRVKSEAWDEGWGVGGDYIMTLEVGNPGDAIHHGPQTNPYLEK